MCVCEPSPLVGVMTGLHLSGLCTCVHTSACSAWGGPTAHLATAPQVKAGICTCVHVCVARVCMHTCETLYMCVRVSVLCVSSHSLHPGAPHSRPRLVPPTFPRCARTGLLSPRGDVCSEVHSPLRGLWGPAFQLSQEGTPRERHGWHSKGGGCWPRVSPGRPRGEPES